MTSTHSEYPPGDPRLSSARALGLDRETYNERCWALEEADCRARLNRRSVAPTCDAAETRSAARTTPGQAQDTLSQPGPSNTRPALGDEAQERPGDHVFRRRDEPSATFKFLGVNYSEGDQLEWAGHTHRIIRDRDDYLTPVPLATAEQFTTTDSFDAVPALGDHVFCRATTSVNASMTALGDHVFHRESGEMFGSFLARHD